MQKGFFGTTPKTAHNFFKALISPRPKDASNLRFAQAPTDSNARFELNSQMLRDPYRGIYGVWKAHGMTPFPYIPYTSNSPNEFGFKLPTGYV
jgi:hypothetical protein